MKEKVRNLNENDETNAMLKAIHENHDNYVAKKRIETMLYLDSIKFQKKKLKRKILIDLLVVLIALLLALSVLID